MSLEQLRAATGFKRTPMQCGPDESAFMGFLAFASGDSKEAQIIQDIFQRGFRDPIATDAKNTALFIDWLIANHWGEEDVTTTQKAVSLSATHGATH